MTSNQTTAFRILPRLDAHEIDDCVDCPAPEDIEDYAPDIALAQHLLHDCGQATPWVLDTLSISIDWHHDEDKLRSSCGRYEIVRDETRGLFSLFVDAILLDETPDGEKALLAARQHKAAA